MWLLGLLLAVLIIKFFNKLTSGKCYAKTVMTGKVAVVTGASGGIGFETALELAKRGAKVIIACRSHQRGERAVHIIRKVAKNKRVRYIHLDLTSLASVRKFCEELKASEAKLDVLINNAGAICTKRERTSDGLLLDEQINHFGPFLLTILLIPILKRTPASRIVLVSSAWHKFGKIEGLNDDLTGYIQAYATTKLCNILFCKELARRLEESDIIVNSLNPGQVNTSLYRSSNILEKLRSFVLYFFFKTPLEGAQTSLYVALSDECDASGRYYEDCKEVKASSKADDEFLASKLWAISEKLVGLKHEELAEVS